MNHPDESGLEDILVKYSRNEIIERLRVDPEFAAKLWNAFGFARVDGHGAGDATGHLDGDHAHDFTPKDLAALAVFVGSDGEVEPAVQLAAARSIGQATARLAEWEAEQIRALSSNPRVSLTVDELAEAAGHLHQLVWRRHLDSFLARGDDVTGGGEVIVGFADIVGYTLLSRRLRLAELEELLETFDSAAHRIITDQDGQVIKTIGDAVMFTVPTAHAAVEVADGLHAIASGGVVPALRIGIAAGPALIRMGDVFGEPVNIAARLASVAREGTTLIDEQLAHLLADDPDVYLSRTITLSVRGYRRLKAHALVASRPAPAAEADTAQESGAGYATEPADTDARAELKRAEKEARRAAKEAKRTAKAARKAEKNARRAAKKTGKAESEAKNDRRLAKRKPAG